MEMEAASGLQGSVYGSGMGARVRCPTCRWGNDVSARECSQCAEELPSPSPWLSFGNGQTNLESAAASSSIDDASISESEGHFTDEELSDAGGGSKARRNRMRVSLSDDLYCFRCGQTNDAVANDCVACGQRLDLPSMASPSSANSMESSSLPSPMSSPYSMPSRFVGRPIDLSSLSVDQTLPSDATNPASSSSSSGPSLAFRQSSLFSSSSTTSSSPSAVSDEGWVRYYGRLPSRELRAELVILFVLISVAIDLTLFVAWLLTIGHGVPWFVYPVAVSVVICGSLYISSRPDLENPWLWEHILVSGTINATILTTWVFLFSSQPYFAYVMWPSAALFGLHLLWGTDLGLGLDRSHKLFYTHLIGIFAPLNLILFTAFITTTPSVPWYVLPLLLTLVPLSAHAFLAFQPDDPHKWFKINLTATSLIAGAFFLLWTMTPTTTPWFGWLWLAGGAIVMGHYAWSYHRDTTQRAASETRGAVQRGLAELSALANVDLRAKAKQAPPPEVPMRPTEAGFSQPTALSAV